MAIERQTATNGERPTDWGAYLAAVDLTHQLIDSGPPRTTNRDAAEERARYRMNRLQQLLAALGNSHRDVPLVHIAGTSGKGSTASAIAAGLSAAGYRTGLHTSPYLQSATENLRLDDQFIGGLDFGALVREVHGIASDHPAFARQPVSYGELWMAMTLHWFAQMRADVAVIETGAGGRFDLSNVIDPVLSVITTIGLDHTETLGPTIADIAWHKAGIIKSGAPIVTGVTDATALEVIVRQAKEAGSRLVFPDTRDRRDYAPNLPASPFQSTNAALAAAALHELGRNGFVIPETAIIDGVADARLPGRFESMQLAPHVLLDGAHNPQKMRAFAETLKTYRLPDGARRTVVFGSLEAKAHDEMLHTIAPLANTLVLTRPQVYGKTGADPAALAACLRESDFHGAMKVIVDPLEAVEAALGASQPHDQVVVTGSMYLVGNARERWFSTRAIVEQRTAWPTS